MPTVLHTCLPVSLLVHMKLSDSSYSTHITGIFMQKNKIFWKVSDFCVF